MLNKEDILYKLKNLNLPKDQYCVMTGSALVLHGVKEDTQDIDIGCSKELFLELLQRGHRQEQLKSFAGIVIDDCIEIFENWIAKKIVYIEDIPVADIDCIREYKQFLAREKDLEDIELIDEYVAARAKSELENECK
ncbi:MAG: hypothetical protein A2Y23_05870 [Clostridiales bacterium GWB2_37_7]|nr:MAG: hypothetical protein A2Y23_05870 [Clostridiales bacterium GWB2_37_7]